MPELQAATDKSPECDLVTVLAKGDPARARAVAAERALTAPILVDDGSLRGKFQVKSTPTTFLLGPDGHALEVLVGGQDRASIERAIARH